MPSRNRMDSVSICKQEFLLVRCGVEKVKLLKEGVEVFVDTVNSEPLHWGAWLELVTLIKDKESLLTLSLPNHWMKRFFLGHIYLELQLNEEGLKIYQHLMDKGFVKSSYIVSQVAMAYNNMRGRSSVV
uniref:Cdc23 domain-containing protein n=1 Tax=Magallana gigas TaxID=29159 RepID=A0A8W8J2G0_MAGGI